MIRPAFHVASEQADCGQDAALSAVTTANSKQRDVPVGAAETTDAG